MSESPTKKAKLTSATTMAAQADAAAQQVIGTHSGSFQCDEALGVWMLRQLPKWRDATLIRSRDRDVLEKCDIVIDVHGVYDHSLLRCVYEANQRLTRACSRALLPPPSSYHLLRLYSQASALPVT